MDVRGLRNSRHGTVRTLAREVLRLQRLLADERRDNERLRGQRTRERIAAARLIEGRRVPVTIIVEPTGDIDVYGLGAAVEIVHTPQVDWTPANRTIIEQWIDATLPESHRPTHWPRCWAGRGHYRLCPTLGRLQAAAIDESILRTLKELERAK